MVKLKLILTAPEDYVNRFCNKLKLNGIVQKKAYRIIDEVTEKGLLVGKNPIGAAAACIYIA